MPRSNLFFLCVGRSMKYTFFLFQFQFQLDYADKKKTAASGIVQTIWHYSALHTYVYWIVFVVNCEVSL